MRLSFTYALAAACGAAALLSHLATIRRVRGDTILCCSGVILIVDVSPGDAQIPFSHISSIVRDRAFPLLAETFLFGSRLNLSFRVHLTIQASV